MLRSISWKQFQEWQAFYSLEPFGYIRDDVRFASVVSTLVNLRRNVDKYPSPFPISDFILKWGDEVEKALDKPTTTGKTWQQLKFMGQMLAAAYNQIESEDEKLRKRRKKG